MDYNETEMYQMGRQVQAELRRAYFLGWASFHEGKDIDAANPYARDDPQRRACFSGWLDARMPDSKYELKNFGAL